MKTVFDSKCSTLWIRELPISQAQERVGKEVALQLISSSKLALTGTVLSIGQPGASDVNKINPDEALQIDFKNPFLAGMC